MTLILVSVLEEPAPSSKGCILLYMADLSRELWFQNNNKKLQSQGDDSTMSEYGYWTGRGYMLHESVRLNNVKHIQRIRREMAERREAREAETEME